MIPSHVARKVAGSNLNRSQHSMTTRCSCRKGPASSRKSFSPIIIFDFLNSTAKESELAGYMKNFIQQRPKPVGDYWRKASRIQTIMTTIHNTHNVNLQPHRVSIRLIVSHHVSSSLVHAIIGSNYYIYFCYRLCLLLSYIS